MLKKLYKEVVTRFANDPYGFVMASFDWGEGVLKDRHPEQWQIDIMNKVKTSNFDKALQCAVASGHGVGKSALVSWLMLWAIATMRDTRGVITANTETQLRTKTWAELGKWYNRFVFKDFFTLEATTIYEKENKHTWRIDAIAWTENNSESFAGLHNQGKRLVILFDEASSIADVIWEVTEGALTDLNTQIIWCAFGNPTRNTGRFRECFRKYRHRWDTAHVDSRDVSHTNKEQINALIDDYGLDNDIVKVRVLGRFPSQSENQFIDTALVDKARRVELREDQFAFAPVIIGVDPAWKGDKTVIVLRQGLFCEVLASIHNDNDWDLAATVARFEKERNADAVFIDQAYGQGVYSAGVQLKREWILVSFANTSGRPDCENKRAEMWANIRDWLRQGGRLPDDEQLALELVTPKCKIKEDGKMLLEKKEEVKKVLGCSPDHADALALTFAYPVERRDNLYSEGGTFTNKKLGAL